MQHALIVGGGIGGLTTALALSQIQQRCTVFERATQFSEVGAGLQLSPNAVGRLARLGLLDKLKGCASFPNKLLVRKANDGMVLGALPLADTMLARYGCPYMTLHRADLHQILLNAVSQTSTVLQTNAAFKTYQVDAEGVCIALEHQSISYTGDYLIGADGLSSVVRQQLLNDGSPQFTGQIVYRALLKQADLPVALRNQDVTVWLAPHLHVVVYPIRAGELLNIVVIMREPMLDQQIANHDWHRFMNGKSVFNKIRTVSKIHSPLLQFMETVYSVGDWRVWNVYDRMPVTHAKQMAQGDKRVALLGDAAHPMRPYLAQGAGMAIEDALALADVMKMNGSHTISTALNQYANLRWKRCAQVQARSRRNGAVFHATGVTRWARDVGIQCLGQRLLNVPWLYGG